MAGTSAVGETDHTRALRCMTLAIAYEAGYEPVAGQEAVAEVILNRTRQPAYPPSVCGVVFQGAARRTGCQFTFTCDGSLNRHLPAQVVANAQAVAERAIDGRLSSRVIGATHYHANYVSPYWAPSLVRVGRIGAHIFYRAPGAQDVSARYAGGPEPRPDQLRGWLTAPDALTARGASTPAPAPAPSQSAVFAPWGLSPNQ
ncbi:MAG TPA: cell wall hydrolase [Novosphingobium sp.]